MKGLRLGGFCLGLWAAAWVTPAALAQWNPPNPVVSFEKQADGLEVQQKYGVLRIEVKSPEVLHVTYAPLGAAAPERAPDWVVEKKKWPAAEFEVSSDEKAITLSTAKLKAVVERESGV
ncbi:MAG: DUF4968 domain-containing protein, partial [Terracidiphilus sp.]